jgi:predicted DNA-binding transcriptional regulator AlpA
MGNSPDVLRTSGIWSAIAMASENEIYLKTNSVRERYGHCSAMWIERRMKDSGFPPPVYFGALRFWRVSDLVEWDTEQIKAAPRPAHDISPAHTPQARAKARRTKGERNRTWDKIV